MPPADGYLTGFLLRDDIEVHLLVPRGIGHPPSEWSAILSNPIVHEINFTTLAEAGRFMDSTEFSINSSSENEQGWSKARFFSIYQQFDAQVAPDDAPALGIAERHTAAAYAAAAAAIGIDALVTNRSAAARSDVGDNDVVIMVSPEDAVALIGHYLRVTSNPVVTVERGRLQGGGSWERTESTGTIVNSYIWGVTSAMTFFDFAAAHAAPARGGPVCAEAFNSILVRLARAARSLDHMLAALSNPLGDRKNDVVETVAEAFDRELLYLAAAFDIYGRIFVWMLDTSKDYKAVRNQSLDSERFLADHVVKRYAEPLTHELLRLQRYAWICKELRNHIHNGILQVQPQPGRPYGGASSIGLMLDGISNLAPDAGHLDQSHYDALGVWMADPTLPFGAPAMCADVATTGFTLMGAALKYVEAFTQLILCNRPDSAPDGSAGRPSRLLGCVEVPTGPLFLEQPESAKFHRAIFGWHPETMG